MELGQQFGPFRPEPIHDPHSRNARAHEDDSPWSEYSSDHSQHGMNPGLAKHGFGESPCGYSGCTHHDEDFNNRLYNAEGTKGTRTTIDFNKVKPHGMEAAIDWGHVNRIRRSERAKGSKEPQVYHHPETDTYHIGDGHHKVIADKLSGRPTVVQLHQL